MNAKSVAEVPENDLVDLLYGDLRLFGNIAIPPFLEWPVDYRLRVTPGRLGIDKSSFGDVDSLVISCGDAGNACAVEFKRVKVTPGTFITGRPNKLPELSKAVDQANVLAAVGFSMVWITVLVVADLREFTGGQFRTVSTPDD